MSGNDCGNGDFWVVSSRMTGTPQWQRPVPDMQHSRQKGPATGSWKLDICHHEWTDIILWQIMLPCRRGKENSKKILLLAAISFIVIIHSVFCYVAGLWHFLSIVALHHSWPSAAVFTSGCFAEDARSLSICSGITRVGVTRGSNRWCHPIFSWKKLTTFF